MVVIITVHIAKERKQNGYQSGTTEHITIDICYK